MSFLGLVVMFQTGWRPTSLVAQPLLHKQLPVDGRQKGAAGVAAALEEVISPRRHRPDCVLVLRNLSRQIRGGDYLWITLRFERAGEVALQVHSQTPTYVEDATDAPGLTSPSPGG
ncbi:hypothetical protein NGM36_02760 [Streptomyces mutabilis]|uniref:hypothetical protein n=1 Tax=Streptomyces mutabilis TaxID=67332 RepID=UPI0022BA4CD0|nr:hypothetical protein [Streptomyces mutabilis]MCZ9348734.1 hypothetical protein [Streptomyces mutabilis]